MKKFVFAMLVVLLVATPAMAKITFNFSNLLYTEADFRTLSTDAGLALSYVPLAPAEPLGGITPACAGSSR